MHFYVVTSLISRQTGLCEISLNSRCDTVLEFQQSLPYCIRHSQNTSIPTEPFYQSMCISEQDLMIYYLISDIVNM